MEKFFRHKKHGTIYPYSERLLNNNAVELVDDKTAHPEKYAAKAVFEHKKQVDIAVFEEVEAPPYTPPELAAQTFKNVKMADKKQKKFVMSDSPIPVPGLKEE